MIHIGGIVCNRNQKLFNQWVNYVHDTVSGSSRAHFMIIPDFPLFIICWKESFSMPLYCWVCYINATWKLDWLVLSRHSSINQNFYLKST